VRIVAPTLAIETVAAGGGSICRFDGTRLLVGPASAEADPGPACYGRGGPLTVTDLNLHLGRLDERQFPFPLDRPAVETRLHELAAELKAGTGQTWTIDALAAGLVEIANATMARAIRSVSVAKGYDPREYLLVAFGGAAGQHACAIADDLQMRQVLLHPEASLLSAFGAGLADVTRHRAAAVHRPWSPGIWNELEEIRQRLAAEVVSELLDEAISTNQIELRWSLELRYRGVDAALVVPAPENLDFAAAFAREHRRLYGYVHEQKPLEVVALRLEGTGRSKERSPRSQQAERHVPGAAATRRVFIEDSWQTIPVYQRNELKPGAAFSGPALVQEEHTCTFLPSGWEVEVWTGGELVLTHNASPHPGPLPRGEGEKTADPIRLQIFHHLFTGIAEQMGHTLRNTASSVNVKERLDFSCALFSGAGELIVNAPHIPVHLGAMSETVRQVQRDNPRMRPGDVFVTNDPFRGGSHLPDVTVVTPVFLDDDEQPTFFVASRAHHAEIGGITPGSMPPFSTSLAEEGVVLRNVCVVHEGRPRFEELEALLRGGRYPSRAVADNLADISAQIAANQHGVEGLLQLTARYGREIVQAYMQHLQSAAEQKMRLALAAFPPGEYRFVDHLDDGTPIAATVTIREKNAAGPPAIIDFSGTGGVLPNNLNANRAITTAATLYVLRLLIGEEVPLNQGLLAAVELRIPPGLLNPPADDDPAKCPAVVGGNVETSQRVVDVLLGAFNLAAASQGTMNNLLFGDGSFGYYETICGGSGATANQPGADAVHTHMTNTRLTDPEVLEQRFPVRLEEFSIRRGSGGNGEHRGGDGVVRRIRFLRPLTLSLLTQRRGEFPPYGLQGGEAGSIGHNRLIRADGTIEELAGCAQIEVQAGDAIEVQTPGGGGWGPSS
jgi:5-oxoprolinase (ATP-hydrolysing)